MLAKGNQKQKPKMKIRGEVSKKPFAREKALARSGLGILRIGKSLFAL
jgi:hypothetical protein